MSREKNIKGPLGIGTRTYVDDDTIDRAPIVFLEPRQPASSSTSSASSDGGHLSNTSDSRSYILMSVKASSSRCLIKSCSRGSGPTSVEGNIAFSFRRSCVAPIHPTSSLSAITNHQLAEQKTREPSTQPKLSSPYSTRTSTGSQSGYNPASTFKLTINPKPSLVTSPSYTYLTFTSNTQCRPYTSYDAPPHPHPHADLHVTPYTRSTEVPVQMSTSTRQSCRLR
ncbi:hypothetical protein M422DRAFT_265564 [Sphaerobolus stellatus SS14]|uniref:Uncharacterized protein n=1 Tax=Sphaerobolus stellatus (strain SS14) TaxID=990650 RepID=A0A0C9UCV7_SPHS4|nr:hypothetical protein M422DRAFT_265564 [Sphaerobolus stellatus SS14]